MHSRSRAACARASRGTYAPPRTAPPYLPGSNDTAGALAAILDDAPSGHHAEEAKRVTFALLLETLNATRSTDIPAALRTLNLAQRETLMKYLYKGLALGGTRAGAAEGINCAVLLLWHEKLTQVAGTGCIMRVMTDRRVL